MQLIKPYVVADVNCGNCAQSCQVVVWNGVKNWDMKVAEELLSETDGVVMVVKLSYAHVHDFVMYAAHTGSHVADRVVLWCEDQRTYDLAAKLLPNVQQLLEAEAALEDDDEENSAHPSH